MIALVNQCRQKANISVRMMLKKQNLVLVSVFFNRDKCVVKRACHPKSIAIWIELEEIRKGLSEGWSGSRVMRQASLTVCALVEKKRGDRNVAFSDKKQGLSIQANPYCV